MIVVRVQPGHVPHVVVNSNSWVVLVIHGGGGVFPMIRSSLAAEARRVVGVAGVVDDLIVPRGKLRRLVRLVRCEAA